MVLAEVITAGDNLDRRKIRQPNSGYKSEMSLSYGFCDFTSLKQFLIIGKLVILFRNRNIISLFMFMNG